ncbi:MAG: hypothetical protein LBR34_01090 [Prevotella sp.]|jgi:chromosome segregation ATPase|nr:hypothetical protein [Prevotella sp.]
MADSQEKLLAELEDRTKQLIALCDFLKRENAGLRNEAEQKEKTIQKLKLDAEQLKTQYDNLRFVRAFASGNMSEKQYAKRQLSKLVHDVDKCIALLKI